MGASRRDREGPEWWAWAAFAVLGSLLLGMLYMSMRQGGAGPIWFFRTGRSLWLLAALGLLAVGIATSALRRPFFGRRRGVAFSCLAVSIGVSIYLLPYPSSREGLPSVVAFRLPVEGEWRVRWGGESREENVLSVLFADRRWALHLVKETADGGPWRLAASSEDHPAWGQAVVAPAAGSVVRVEDHWPDAPSARAQAAPPKGGSRLGNHLVLEVAPGEYLFLTNLMRDSVTVAEGERVEAGAQLARVGSSGLFVPTQEPHAAVHLQTTPRTGWGEAIPWTFHGYEAGGARVEKGMPRGGTAGQRVRHLGEASDEDT